MYSRFVKKHLSWFCIKFKKKKNQNDYVLLSILSLKDNDFRKVQISNDLSDASLWITDVLFIDSATFIMWINGKQFITKGNGCIFEEIAFPEIYRENEEKMTVLNTYYYTKRNALISLVRNVSSHRIELWQLAIDLDSKTTNIINISPINCR
eukprot:621621_1